MPKKVLIAYATRSGSTAEIAQAIAEELGAGGAEVDVHLTRDVEDVGEYDAVVLGGPVIIGWHRDAMKFLGRYKNALVAKPVAYFIVSLEFCRSDTDQFQSIPIFQQPAHGEPPANPNKLRMTEKHNSPAGYLAPVLKKAPAVKPVEVAFFSGYVDYSKQDLFGWLFLKLLIGAKAGDFRDWGAIRGWAADLRAKLGLDA
jgi:menaquinone-dependent protoporphyrinogen oxidase